ncbi:DUF4328 domain-containing protein [Leptospira venezuelensis]|uniref:DUF4328 domain-containing protein n=1 Tax=Leptospira venezuelensis TaxID=1958811 RepID=UPI0012FFCB5A|nr:DUF4328 domain-containing protein [Leptospira venezuelensis]
MENTKPRWTKARIAIIVIWVLLILNIISLLLLAFQFDLFLKIKNGIEVSEIVIETNEYIEGLTSLVVFGFYLISGFTFLNWFASAYLNLIDRVPNLSATNTQLVLSWFLPIICLYRPFEIMKELFRRTEELLTIKGFASGKIFNISLITWWWNLWIFDNLLIIVKRNFLSQDRSIEELLVGIGIGIFECSVYIPLVIITTKLIRDYGNVEYLISQIPIDQSLSEAI